MRDPKKQAQAEERPEDRQDRQDRQDRGRRKLREVKENLGKGETERKESRVYCKWQKILRNREVVTDSEEMTVYAEYIRQCVNEYLEEYLGDKKVYFLATLYMTEEEPTLRMDVCKGNPNCFTWLSEGLRYRGLLDFRYVSHSSIEIVFKGLVRKMLKREGERLRITGLRQPLSSVILNTVVFLVNEYVYVNLPKDGIL